MKNETGEKIKGLARTIFIVEIIFAIIAGIALMVSKENLIIIGLLVLFGGCLIAWVSFWLLYGFGEIIDKLYYIEKNTCVGEHKSKAQSNVVYERIDKIEKLRSQGLITEEEYQQVISK